jgi:hypothetical protein
MLYAPTPEERARLETLDLCVLTPVQGYQCWARFTKALVNMVAYSWSQGLRVWQIGIVERAPVQWARNDLGRTALAHINEYNGKPFTHFLWLDDDHVFNPDLALALARHASLDMVSALYYSRSKPLPVVYVKDHSDDPYKHYPLIEVPPALVEVHAVGFGALLMRREVLERVPEPWFTIDSRGGEDIVFCVHARRHGVRVWLEGGYKLGHIGDPQIVTEETYRKYLDETPELADRVCVELGQEEPRDAV